MTSPSLEVEASLRSALVRIERAQNELAAACADLSGIAGGALPFWDRCSKLSERCRQLWHALNNRDRRRWHLDGMHTARSEE